MNLWYNNLKKSNITPPAYVFTPVWILLYTLMTISLIFYLRSNYTIKGLVLFSIQFILNILWSPIFFSKHLICSSTLVNLGMNIFLYYTYVEFRKSSTIASNLLIPYMIWIALALYLNFYICLNN